MKHLIPKFYNMTVYEKIRAIRISKDYKQSYVAYCLNIDSANYGRMERGETKITIDRLEAIAKIFEINMLDLLCEEHTEFQPTEKEILSEMKKNLNLILDELKHIKNDLNQLK
ncbi:MAG: XRE family transcriptional regulator [Chitinophagaceae bacterium]|nr:MAG: XRE family transcriptional regulator [Chitinophagaceae bacterium]